MDNSNIIQAVTKGEAAYEFLKARILQMELKPGQRIVIRDISKQLNISDIPVREALNKLQSENLVEMKPHVGFAVSAVSDKKIYENLQVKYELEIIAIKNVVANITAEELAKAEEMLTLLKELNAKKDYISYFRTVRQYNLLLYRNCGNDVLYNMILHLFEITESLGTIYALVPGWCDYSVKTHYEIFEAIRNKDDEKAAQLLRELKFGGLSQVINRLGSYGCKIEQEKQWKDKIQEIINRE